MTPYRLAFPFAAAIVSATAIAGSYETIICVSDDKTCLDSDKPVYASVAHTCWFTEGDHIEMRLRRDGEVVDTKGKAGVHSLLPPPDSRDFTDLAQYVYDIPGDYGFSIDAVALSDKDGSELETESDGAETVKFCRWYSVLVSFGDGCPRPVTATLDDYSRNYDGTPMLSLGPVATNAFSITYKPTDEEIKKGGLTLSGVDGEWDCNYTAEIPLDGCDPDREPGTTDPKLGSVDLSVFAGSAPKGGLTQTVTLRVKADEWDGTLLTRASVKAVVRDAAPNRSSFVVALKPANSTTNNATNPIRCTSDDGGLRLVETPDANIVLTNYPAGGYEIVSISKTHGARLWSVSVAPHLPAGADTNLVHGLRVTESITGRAPRTWDYLFEEQGTQGQHRNWSLVSAGLVGESEEIADTSPTARSVRRRVFDPATGVPVSDTLDEERLFDWGWSRVAETLDPDGAALRTEWAYAESGAGRYGRVTNVVDRYGTATSTEYDALGRVVRTVSPTPAGPRVVQSSYAPVDARDDGTVSPLEARSVTETVGGVITARRWTVLFERDGLRTRITESAASQTAAFGASSNVRETRVSYSPARLDRLAGREVLHIAADGIIRTNAFAYGLLDATSSNPADWTFANGADSTGGVLRVASWTAPSYAPGGLPGRTTIDVSYLDGRGREIFAETRIVTASGSSERLSWTATAYDALGRPLSVRRSDGSLVESAYGRFGPIWRKDASGAVTTTEYDALGRVTRTSTASTPPNSPFSILHSSFEYDAAGRIVSETKWSSPPNSSTNSPFPILHSSFEYDLAGREIRRLSEDGIEQTTDYGRLGNTVFYWTRTVRAPAPERCANPAVFASTNTAYSYKCGKEAWTEFNGVRRETYAYGVNADGTQWVRTWNGPDGNASPAWTLATDSFLGGGSACCGGGGVGRTATRSRPGSNGSILTTSYAYDRGGRIISETLSSSRSGLLSRTLRAYDALGDLAVTAQDIDLDGAIGLGGPDRVTSNGTAHVKISGDWWRESRSYSFPLDGDATPVLSGITRQRLTGLGPATTQTSPSSGGAGERSETGGVLASESVSIDALGNATTIRLWRDRDACATFSETLSPASTLSAWSFALGGLVLTNRSSTGVVTSRTYDGFGRTLSSTDGRGNATAYTYDACGNLVSATDATGATTTYAYDALNRQISVTTPSTLQPFNSSTTYTAYDAEDRVIAQWGATYPVLYSYDAFGRLATLSTTRDEEAAAHLSTLQPFNLSTGRTSIPWDTTEWRYDEATGLLTNKLYADGLGPSYTYTDDGKLATRLWARGVLTSYAYDFAGNLTNVMQNAECRMQNGGVGNPSTLQPFNPSTMSYSYDRMGRMSSAIVDGVSTNYYSYSIHGQLTNEVQNGVAIALTYDSLNRPTGYSLCASAPLRLNYSYDSLGRFSGIGFNAEAQGGGVEYGYLPGTDFVSGYTATKTSPRSGINLGGTAAQTSPRSGINLLTRSVIYEAHRDLISAVTNAAVNPSTLQPFNLSTFAYLNDAAGRRVEITRSGAAFGALSGAADSYGYNDRSEVVSTRRALGGEEVRGFGYDYAYDPIGNRLSATEYAESGDALASAYSANALNQYTSRTVPGTAQVRGFADSGATVTVNGNGTWRSGEYFYGGDDADNTALPVFKELAIEAVRPAPTPDDYDEIAAVTGRVFVAQTPEQFTYDADGNMLTDGRFRYTWNAENRLVRAQELVAPTNRNPYTVAYAYDHKGRMVSKRITENDGSDTLVKSITYIWDGWNIIREIQWPVTSGQWPVVTDNVWGLDLNGTLQGAGGVGGLLAVIRSNSNSNSNSNSSLYFPTYDANGNISEYVTTNGEIVAHYDYSPFGETLIESGDLADIFTHRFSTKPWCPVTGLYEYQTRKYRPEIGRWLNRDPMEEKGCVHLSAFVDNNAQCQFDALGQLSLRTPLDSGIPNPQPPYYTLPRIRLPRPHYPQFPAISLPGFIPRFNERLEQVRQLIAGMRAGLEVRSKFLEMIDEYECCPTSGACTIDKYDGVINGNMNSWTIAHRITGCRLKAVGMDRDNVVLLNSLHETYEFFRLEFLAFIKWDDVSSFDNLVDGVIGSIQEYLTDTIADINAVMEGYDTDGNNCYSRFIPEECHKKNE